MTNNDENFIDRKIFVPKEIHKIKLRKGETLVWGLDFEQYKNLPRDKVHDLMKIMRENLKKQFPKNNVIVTLGITNLTTITEEEASSLDD